MSSFLCWESWVLFGQALPDERIGRGEYVRLVMNNRFQFAFLGGAFPVMRALDEEPAPIWLESAGERYYSGTPEFCSRIGTMIRSRGLMANLSIRENLLLPFLYGEDQQLLAQKMEEVDEVAEFVGLSAHLNEQAGERSAYTHAMVSLGHCLLSQPDIIVAQEVHVGMPPERLQRFSEIAIKAIERLGSGVLYITSSEHEGSGINFDRTYKIEDDSVPDVSGVW